MDCRFHLSFQEPSFGSTDWQLVNGVPTSDRLSTARVVDGDGLLAGQHVLRVTYPALGVGPVQSGVQFPVCLDKIRPYGCGFRELRFRYFLFFENGFDFVLGGKLPGLMGGDRSWEQTGGVHPDGTNGWSLRLMWREGGAAVVYAYLPGLRYGGSTWGHDFPLGKTFQTNRWYQIDQQVVVNSVGQDDGELSVAIDGEPVLNVRDLCYRTIENSAGLVGGVYFSTFHGGNTADWAPEVDSFARFGGIELRSSMVSKRTH